uniref:Odorant-binding protein 4 n=1 Tax=Rhyzopertha dominica TaxID=92692 RepID=A0A120GVA9_RHYDO|nr:odorant-binding protein 4 [Rhyzopertha dominica]
MTQRQVEAAQRLARNMCQPKTKVTNEQIEAMHNGNFDDSKTLMCYIDCVYQTFKVIKNGVFDLDNVKMQLEQLPENISQIVLEASIHCKDKAIGTEKCELAYNLGKCIFEFDKESFLVP